MSLQLRFNLTRFLNPNRKPYLLKSLSTSAADSVDDQILRQQPAAPSSVNCLKKFVDKLLTFDDVDLEKKEKFDKCEEDGGSGGGVSVRKRMLEKMRDEWKAFRDDDGGGKIGEGVEFGDAEEEEEVWSEGDDSFLDLEENCVKKWSYEEVEEGMNGSTEEKESRSWTHTHDLGELVEGEEEADDENSKLRRLGNVKEKRERHKQTRRKTNAQRNLDDTLQMLKTMKKKLFGNAKEKRERLKEKRRKNSARSNLDDTLQMSTTTKEKLLGKLVNSKGAPLSSASLDDKINSSVGLTECVNNEELQDTLKRLEKDLNEEKEQLRLYRDKVVKDSIQKLRSAMIKEEEHIRSKFNKALRESIHKLQQEVTDQERYIKTSFNHLLMESYSKMHEQFQKERKHLASSYNSDSTNSS